MAKEENKNIQKPQARDRRLQTLRIVLSKLTESRVLPSLSLERPKNIRAMENALASMTDMFGAVSAERIVDVCVTGACRYNGKTVTVAHVLSDIVIQATSSLTKGRRWHQDRWLLEHGIQRCDLEELARNAFTHPLAHLIYIAGEDATKAYRHNTEAGFYGCQISTTGWAPRSRWCRECKFDERCKEQTQKNFHELYRLRTEDYEGD